MNVNLQEQAPPATTYEEETDSSPDGDESDKEQPRRVNSEQFKGPLRNDTNIVIFIAFVVVVVVAVTIAVVNTTRKRNAQPTSTPAPSAAPTILVAEPQDQLDFIRAQVERNPNTASYLSVLPTSASDLTGSETDPLGQAAYWLLQVDTRNQQSNLLRRFALATIYYNNGGVAWKNNTNWLSSESHCTWFGVGCCGALAASNICASIHDPNAIANLNMPDNGVTGTIESFYALLLDLQSLNLSYNQLNGTLPNAALGSMPLLKALYLQYNNMTGPLTGDLKQNVLGTFVFVGVLGQTALVNRYSLQDSFFT